MSCMATIIEKTQDVGRSCRFYVFLHNPHSQSLLHKAWELFIEYLAHSSFKDFARLIVFIEVLIMCFKALSSLCQICVFSGV